MFNHTETPSSVRGLITNLKDISQVLSLSTDGSEAAFWWHTDLSYTEPKDKKLYTVMTRMLASHLFADIFTSVKISLLNV